MQKKLSAYLGLIVILGSFLAAPIQAIAAATESSSANQETAIVKPESTKSESNSDEVSSEATTSNNLAKESSNSISGNSGLSEKTTESSTESQPRAPSARSTRIATQSNEITNILTKVSMTDSNGNPLDTVDQYKDIKMTFDFALPNNKVYAGDTSTITLPNELKFTNDQTFEIKNSNGVVIANASIDASTKKITLVYTDAVEQLSDITGSFYFSVRIDMTTVTTDKEVPINIDDGAEPIFGGNLDYGKTTDDPNEAFSKSAWFDAGNNLLLNYSLRINGSGKDYTGSFVSDNLESDKLSYVEDSFHIKKGTWHINDAGQYQLDNATDVTSQFKPKIATDGRSFSIDFGNISSTEGYSVDYQVKVDGSIKDQEVLKNNAALNGNNITPVTSETESIYQAAGGNANGYNYTLKIHKTDAGDPNKGLAGAEFNVIRTSTNTSVGHITTDDSGNGQLGSLLKDDYTITEIKAPVGYQLSNDSTKVTAEELGESADKTVLKDITNQQATTSVTGTKTWNDNNNQDGKRPAKITVNLLANGTQKTSKIVTAADNWEYSFENLPKYENGKEITYTVSETSVDGYESKVDGFNITNTHQPETTSVQGTKTWDDSDNQDGKRPDKITVNLLADGVKVDSKTVSAADNWRYDFTDLAKYKDGHEIVYTVTEDAVPGYSSIVDGYKITNNYTPGKTSFDVTKVWTDADNQDGLRPAEIKVQLYADGEKSGDPVTLTAENDWHHNWTDLDAKHAGKAIAYTVKEVNAVAGYTETTTIDGNNAIITNTHQSEITNVQGTKTWDDSDNQDGKRPDKITVNLLANGKAVKSQTVTQADNWQYNFENLPKYEAGKAITYTVSEDVVEGYKTEINGFDITNTYNPESTTIAGTKTWDDNDDQDGKRPNEITINLLANGTKIKSQTVTAIDKWQYNFGTLPKYENGKAIIYTVTEDAVADYSTEVNNFNITNRYTPGKTSVSVTKAWRDNNDSAGLRPNTITVQLYANGKKTGAAIKLAAATNWTHTWSDLAAKNAGKAVNYTVKEVGAVAGYTTKTDAINQGNIVITNQLVLGSVTLTKTDKSSHEALQGAVFKLQNQKGKTVRTNLITNANGKLSVDDLAPGDYQFIETAAATGYSMDTKPVKFTIVKNQQTAVQVQKTNKLTPGTVVLEKIDDKTGEKLAGATFKLLNTDGKVVIKAMTTDATGKLAIKGLAPGNYQLVETKAPDGYVLDATPVKVAVKKAQKEVTAVTKTNKQKNHAVRIEKVDSKTGQGLIGAKFELRTIDGNTLRSGLTTDRSGTLAIDGLAVGDYVLVETKAPRGYVLDQQPYSFTIAKNTQLVTLRITNNVNPIVGTSTKTSIKPTSANYRFPQTGEQRSTWILLSGLVVIALAGALVLKQKNTSDY